VEAKYNIGDLVILNEFGRLVLDSKKNPIGLIVSGPRYLTYPLYNSPEEEILSYWSYDLIVGDELLTNVPQEFLKNTSN